MGALDFGPLLTEAVMERVNQIVPV